MAERPTQRIIVDRFSALDEIPKKLSGEDLDLAVIALLRKHGRFSCWEPYHVLCTISRLARDGRIKLDPVSYPWTAVIVRD